MQHNLFSLLHANRILTQVVSRITARRAELGPDEVFAVPLHPDELITLQMSILHAVRTTQDGMDRLDLARHVGPGDLVIALRGLAVISGESQIVLWLEAGGIALEARPMIHQLKCTGPDCTYNSGTENSAASKSMYYRGSWMCCRPRIWGSGLATPHALHSVLDQQLQDLGAPLGPGIFFVQSDDGALYSAVKVPTPLSPPGPGDDHPAP